MRTRLLSILATLAALAALAAVAGAQSLYWLDANYAAPTINRATAEGVALSTMPLGAGTLPEGLALDATGKIYWTESSWANASLNRVGPTLGTITPVVTGGSAFRGVVVDPAAQLIYWTTSNLVTGPTIRRATLTGASAVTLITLPAGANPRGIALGGGRIYWADFDLGAIYRANLDGTAVTAWLTLTAGTRPYGVALDGTGRVYWTDYNGGTIRRANSDASGVVTLLSGLANPTYLAIDVAGARMYWADGGAGSQRIRRAAISGGAITNLPCPLTTYGGLVFQPSTTVATPEAAMPTEFALERPWPNPANGPIQVRFSLPHETAVRLAVYDLQGREVAVLADGVMPAGSHEQAWGARGAPAPTPAGIYFVRLTAAGQTWVRRVVRIP